MVTQDKLIELLREGVVEVSFTKKDNTVRHMRCTTRPDVIPTALQPKGAQLAKNPTQIRVFDVDVNGWRSFTYDRLIDVKVDVSTVPHDPLTLSVCGIIILFLLTYMWV